MNARSGEKWSREEEDDLLASVEELLELEDIAAFHERTTFAIVKRMEYLVKKRQLSYETYAAYKLSDCNGLWIHDALQELRNPEQEPLPKEKQTMNTTVTQKTFIGERPAQEFTVEELLDVIEKQSQFIERLEAIKSTATVKKLIAKHQTNIDALVEVLEEIAA